MDKTQLVDLIIEQLNIMLSHAVAAAEEAHKGATHDQSKAETQYDTLGLEHAYLAEGQGRRIEELKDQISQLGHLVPKSFGEDDPIYLGALVTLANINEPTKTLNVFLTPCAGGLKVNWLGKNVHVVSPNSPITQALLGLFLGDECSLASGLKYDITQVM